MRSDSVRTFIALRFYTRVGRSNPPVAVVADVWCLPVSPGIALRFYSGIRCAYPPIAVITDIRCQTIAAGNSVITFVALISLVAFFPGYGHFVSIIKQPLAVHSPVVFPVRVLLHADNGRCSVLALFSLLATLAVLDGYIAAFEE